MSAVEDAVYAAIQIGAPGSKHRTRALKSVKWVIVTESGGVVCNDDRSPMVFDGRDNEVMKCRYYSVLLKCKCTPELWHG